MLSTGETVCRLPCTLRVSALSKGTMYGREPVRDLTHWSQGAVTHYLSPCVDPCADLPYLLCYMEFWNLEAIHLA